ncbi:MAG: DUF4340 domain-containing protein, partial [Clostridia bacterium]|nr:DUF4340 domain-containing protein [Clostridia bacterium]
MTKKAKKRIITLVSLLLVFGLLLGGYFIGKKLNEEEAVIEEDEGTVVFDAGKSIVTKMSFVNEDAGLTFVYENDKWVYESDKNYPLDQSRLAAMADTVTKVTAVATVTDASDDLSVYGLADPVITADITYSDKNTASFKFGATNNFNNAQYFMIGGDDAVYMAATTVAGAFDVDLDYLYGDEEYQLMADKLQAKNISSITLETKDGKSKEITDETGVSDLYDLVYTLSLDKWEDYYADSAEMESEYGISPEGDRITLKYTASVTTSDESGNTSTVDLPKEYTVYIGHKFEDVEEESADDTAEGETTSAEEKEKFSYFYSPEGSTVVYTID